MNNSRKRDSILENITRFRHNSIVIRNFGLVVVAMIVPLMLVVWIVRMNINDIVQEEIQNAGYNSLVTTAKTIDSIIDKMFSFSYYLTENQEFNLLYVSDLEGVLEEYKSTYEKYVKFNILVEEYIDSAYIYLEPYNIILCDAKGTRNMQAVYKEDMTDISWLTYYDNYTSQRNYSICSRRKNDFYPYLMSMIRPIIAGRDNRRGAVILNVDMLKLSRQLGYENDKEIKFFMLGEEGNLLYTNQEELLERDGEVPDYLTYLFQEKDEVVTKEIEGITYIISNVNSESYECRYILCTPMTYFEKRLDEVNRFIWNVIIFTLILGILVAYIVTLHSFRPIQRIMNEIDDNTEEGIKVKGEISGDKTEDERFENELHYITEMVKLARRRSDRFQMETEMWMRKLSDAQMLALQNQIDPHYLYNTLDMINWEAVKLLGYDNSISDMLSTLAQFFRMGLQKNSYLISVSEELEHARLYVIILEKRYAGSIQVKWDISKEVLRYKMIRHTLQPLIENAINHGFRPRRYEGNILIRAGILDELVYLAVDDDGVGMELEECVKMNYELMNHYEAESEHVGIRNVNQRIKILFGDEYGVNIMRTETGGLSVRMILPPIE